MVNFGFKKFYELWSLNNQLGNELEYRYSIAVDIGSNVCFKRKHANILLNIFYFVWRSMTATFP